MIIVEIISFYTQSTHYTTYNVISNRIHKIHNTINHSRIERISFEIPLTIYELAT